MARFDLYRDDRNYLLDVQADTLGELNIRVVVPVRLPDAAPFAGEAAQPDI